MRLSGFGNLYRQSRFNDVAPILPRAPIAAGIEPFNSRPAETALVRAETLHPLVPHRRVALKPIGGRSQLDLERRRIDHRQSDQRSRRRANYSIHLGVEHALSPTMGWWRQCPASA